MLDFKKLSELGYGDSLSFEGYVHTPQIRYVQNDVWSAIKDMEIDEKYLTHFNIKIYISDVDEGTDTEVGFIKGDYIQPEEAMFDECSFFEICDAANQELEEMAEAILDKNLNFKEEIADETDCIGYIPELYINKKFRNMGIGSFVLEHLAELLYHYTREMITKVVVLPEPAVRNRLGYLQSISESNKNKEKLEQSLIKFYKNNKFIEIPDTRYLIKDLSNDY